MLNYKPLANKGRHDFLPSQQFNCRILQVTEYCQRPGDVKVT